MTSGQRKVLQAIASKTEPIAQIGKGGINDNLLKSLSDALEKRELIKINALENSGMESRELGDELARLLGAECVIAIGRKIVLYRKSKRKDVKHIEF